MFSRATDIARSFRLIVQLHRLIHIGKRTTVFAKLLSSQLTYEEELSRFRFPATNRLTGAKLNKAGTKMEIVRDLRWLTNTFTKLNRLRVAAILKNRFYLRLPYPIEKSAIKGKRMPENIFLRSCTTAKI